MIEKEKEIAIKTGITIDVYIDQALKVLDRLNPINSLTPLMTASGKGTEALLNPQDPRIKGIIDTWLTMFDELLRVGKDLPIDLIARAAVIARQLRSQDAQKETT